MSTFDCIRNLINDLKDDECGTLCENKNLKNALKEAKENVCQMEGVNEKLIEELDHLDVAEIELRGETERLRRCIALKTQEIQKLCDEISCLEDENSKLKSNVACANEMNCDLEQQVSELEMCIKEKDDCISRLKKKAAKINKKICEMKNAIKHISNENECLNKDMENCKCDVQKAEKELKCLCSKHDLCTSAKAKLQDQVECMESILKRNCETLQRERALVCELREQNKCSQRENKKLNMDNFDFHLKKMDLTGALVASNKQLKRTQREYNQAKCEYENLKKCFSMFQDQCFSFTL